MAASIFTYLAVEPTLSAYAQQNEGAIFVTDTGAGTSGKGALFSVEISTGTRSLYTDFGNANQGTTGDDPSGVKAEAQNIFWVVDSFAGTNNQGALFGVVLGGNRVLFSDFGDPNQGALGVDPFGIALDASGNIWVVDKSAGTNNQGALFAVDPNNVNRTMISDFGDPNQGALGENPVDVAIDSSGNIWVVDSSAGTGLGALFNVDQSGSRTLVSDFLDPNQGLLGEEPFGVATGSDTSGNILVVDKGGGTNNQGRLFKVDPNTGNRIMISDFGDINQGDLGQIPTGVVVDPSSGRIYVIDPQGGTNQMGALFHVEYSNGFRTLISDFGDPTQGVLGEHPEDLSIVPVQTGGCLIATATYGTELAPQVQMLREIRDNSLLQTHSGQAFMESFNEFYYSFSPAIADYERENPIFREIVKIGITPLIASLSILNYVDMDSEAEVLGYGISLIVLNGMMYVGIPAIVIMRIRK